MTHIKPYPCICPAPKLILFQMPLFGFGFLFVCLCLGSLFVYFKKEVADEFLRRGGSERNGLG